MRAGGSSKAKKYDSLFLDPRLQLALPKPTGSFLSSYEGQRGDTRVIQGSHQMQLFDCIRRGYAALDQCMAKTHTTAAAQCSTTSTYICLPLRLWARQLPVCICRMYVPGAGGRGSGLSRWLGMTMAAPATYQLGLRRRTTRRSTPRRGMSCKLGDGTMAQRVEFLILHTNIHG